MTIITYKDGIMASDSAMIGSYNTIVGYAPKIFSISNHLVGISGRIGQANRFLSYFEDTLAGSKFVFGDIPSKLPDIPTGDFLVLIVCSDGTVLRYPGTGYPTPVEANFHAIGSGAMLAMGAMAHGASAEEAAKIAVQLDALSNGPIQKKIYKFWLNVNDDLFTLP